MGTRKTRRNELLLFLFTAGILAATILVRSSGDSSDEEKFLAADAVCDSALNKRAARSLESLSGIHLFKDSTLDKFDLHSFPKVAAALVRDAGKTGRRTTHQLCVVESGSDVAHLSISFAWGKGKVMESFGPWRGPMQFKEFDALIFRNDAMTGFPCPVEGKFSSQRDGVLLQAKAIVYARSVKERKEAAYILHSVSVKMAEEMGCLKESGLPKKLDRLTLVPTKATKK